MDAGESAFHDLMKKIEEEGFTQQIQLFLTVLLPQQLVKRSIQLLYFDATIVCHVAKNSRRIFWTVSSKEKKYIIFSSCISYYNQVVRIGQYPFCKHILTILICEALQKKGDYSQFSIEEIDDTVFSEVLASDTFFANLETKKS